MRVDRRMLGLRLAMWLLVSIALHALLWLRSFAAAPADASLPLALPTQVQFGLASAPGHAEQAAAPAPKPPVDKPAHHRARPLRDPNAFGRSRAEHVVSATDGSVARDRDEDQGHDGDGVAPLGATLALNVDLARVRQSALLLELPSILDIVPEWQQLLAGSGIDAPRDLERVFVAMPDLQGASLVVAAQHHLPRARLEAAVSQLAAAEGKPATFRSQANVPVAPWRSRGSTERVIALSGADQFILARDADLARVLAVSRSLAETRKAQGFSLAELDAQGGLLAMREREAVALWIEGLDKYVRGDVAGLPRSLRLSIAHVDQFHTELRVRGQYAAASEAGAALSGFEALRGALSRDPQVSFLGLSSAMDSAVIEQDHAALALQVRLTLHQTRYLLRFVRRLLHR